MSSWDYPTTKSLCTATISDQGRSEIRTPDRDQPLFHRDSSRAPVSHSTLPEIFPPPPRHTFKTFGTLTALSFVGIGVYAFAPSSFTGINKETALKEAIDDFKNAWTKPPVFDKDNSAINYLGHPYFGMNFYLSQRNYGESPLYSFFFSTFTSTAFEYFIESWAEQPSIQDLIITPIVGSILGELVYLATQELRKDGFTKAEKVILTLINPALCPAKRISVARPPFISAR